MRNNIMNDAKVEKDKGYINKFDFSAGNSNTASIGRVDIGFSQVLVPGSKMLLKQEQLVRMAPLVAPTYAKQFFKTWGMQIPIEDIWPNFSSMMTKESVSRNGNIILPEKTPWMNANTLLTFCLAGSHISIFRLRNRNNSPDVSPLNNVSNWECMPLPSHGSTAGNYFRDVMLMVLQHCSYVANQDGTTSFDFGSILGLSDSFNLPVNNYGPASFFEPDSGPGFPTLQFYDKDLVLKPDFSIICRIPVSVSEGTSVVYDGNDFFKFNIRLSSFGRQIYKNLRALGYPCDFGNSSKRTLLHLFAAYKAYWDIFGLNQFQNWEETYASRFLTYMTNTTEMDVFNRVPTAQWSNFKNFMLEEFSQMWVTEKDDYVSAHLPQPTISPTMTGVYGVADAQPNNGSVGGVLNDNVIQQLDSSGQVPLQPAQPVNGLSIQDGHAYMKVIEHSHLDSEALKRLYKMTNRNTMLGREIAKLMEARGLGMYMQRTRTNMIGETTMTLDISPVFSTSDTYNEATEEGSNVGDYAGKGVGYRKDDKSMFCKTESFCWVIVLTAVTSDSGYSQGEDITTRCVEGDDFYQPAFEALGQELHEKSVVCSTSDGVVVDVEEDSQGQNVQVIKTSGSEKSFGYATRYSGWKVGRSCSNGGFALASERDNFTPFIGDKLIFPEERFDYVVSNPSQQDPMHVYGSYRLLSFDNLPTAGNAWRFLMRYPWMQNLLRIFRSKGKQYVGALLSSSNSLEIYEKTYLLPENYMVFDDFWCKVWAPMLPIAETYGTIDPDKKELEFVDRA